MREQFGAKITKENKAYYSKSEHWKGSKFENLEKTTMDFSLKKMPEFLQTQFCDKENRAPNNNLPFQVFDKNKFLEASPQPKFAWFGHSVLILNIDSKIILIDPMFGPNAAPISPFAVKRFTENSLAMIDNLPDIDLVCITHDHYDHLDYDSIIKLKSKVKHFYVALGVSRHLEKWGIEKSNITEFDWWQSQIFNDIKITFTPTRHFSGRGLTDRAKSLWGGWAFKTVANNIWFSGDGGFGNHFKSIGDKLGPFDFAFMECGQYNENWHQIHMYPEESAEAAKIVNCKTIMPVHWAGFVLAQHTWTEPVERFSAECQKLNQDFIVPRLGEVVTLNSDYQTNKWWQ